MEVGLAQAGSHQNDDEVIFGWNSKAGKKRRWLLKLGL